MCVNLSALPLPVLGPALDESRLLLIAYLALLGHYDRMETPTGRVCVVDQDDTSRLSRRP